MGFDDIADAAIQATRTQAKLEQEHEKAQREIADRAIQEAAAGAAAYLKTRNVPMATVWGARTRFNRQTVYPVGRTWAVLDEYGLGLSSEGQWQGIEHTSVVEGPIKVSRERLREFHGYFFTTTAVLSSAHFSYYPATSTLALSLANVDSNIEGSLFLEVIGSDPNLRVGAGSAGHRQGEAFISLVARRVGDLANNVS